MVEVIDPRPDNSVARNVVCGQCGVKLRYVPNDVRESHGRDISGGPDGMKWVECPNCSGRAVIERW